MLLKEMPDFLENPRYTFITYRIYLKEEWVGYITCEFNYTDKYEVKILISYRLPIKGKKLELIDEEYKEVFNTDFKIEEIERRVRLTNPELVEHIIKLETKSWIFNFKSNNSKVIQLKEFLIDMPGFEITDNGTNKFYVFSGCTEEYVLQVAFDNFMI